MPAQAVRRWRLHRRQCRGAGRRRCRDRQARRRTGSRWAGARAPRPARAPRRARPRRRARRRRRAARRKRKRSRHRTRRQRRTLPRTRASRQRRRSRTRTRPPVPTPLRVVRAAPRRVTRRPVMRRPVARRPARRPVRGPEMPRRQHDVHDPGRVRSYRPARRRMGIRGQGDQDQCRSKDEYRADRPEDGSHVAPTSNGHRPRRPRRR